MRCNKKVFPWSFILFVFIIYKIIVSYKESKKEGNTWILSAFQRIFYIKKSRVLQLRRIFLWILVLGLPRNDRGTLFFVVVDSFSKMAHLFHVVRPIMLPILLIYSLLNLVYCMASLILLSPIAMLNFWDIFVELCRKNWELSCYFLLLVTHKWMVTQNWWIVLCLLCCTLFWKLIWDFGRSVCHMLNLFTIELYTPQQNLVLFK